MCVYVCVFMCVCVCVCVCVYCLDTEPKAVDLSVRNLYSVNVGVCVYDLLS